MSSKRASRTRNWAERQRKDPYVQKAREGAFRSRAAFKLQQLDQKERLLRPGMLVVDLGAAPGSWSQYAVSRVGPTGTIVAVDRLEMKAIPGVHQIVGDFLDQEISEELHQALGERPVDLVISDLAPNLTGISAVDDENIFELNSITLKMALNYLNKSNGALILKTFQNSLLKKIRLEMEKSFNIVQNYKPAASKSKSGEIYLYGEKPL